MNWSEALRRGGAVISVLIFAAVIGNIFLGWTDYDANWAPAYKYIPAKQFDTYMKTGAATDSSWISPGYGGAPVKVVGSTTTGGTMTTGFAMNTGNTVTVMLPWPEDADMRFTVAFRALWTSTQAQGPTWQYNIKDMAPNDNQGTESTAIHGSGVDSLTATRDSIGTANYMGMSKWDTLASATSKAYAGKMVKIGVKLQDVSVTPVAGARDVWLYGIEMAYVPRRTEGGAYRGTTLRVPGHTSLGIEKGATLAR